MFALLACFANIILLSVFVIFNVKDLECGTTIRQIVPFSVSVYLKKYKFGLFIASQVNIVRNE